ncbi:MAG: hypothetical protein ACREV5_06005 [Steroidobacter sp.]
MNIIRREPLNRASMKGLTMFFAAMCLSMAAQADDASRDRNKPAQGTQAHFESLDRNNDRELSKVEAKADPALAARFAKFDVNLNGFITKNEYDAMSQMESQTDESSSDADNP